MAQIYVKAAVLNARPEDVYAAIADYRNGHPNIVPKESIYDLQVEQGGYGEGTIIRFKAKVLGVELAFCWAAPHGRGSVQQGAIRGRVG